MEKIQKICYLNYMRRGLVYILEYSTDEKRKSFEQSAQDYFFSL